jgi:RNA polymerase sigma-70 factor (ECF subfamily)
MDHTLHTQNFFNVIQISKFCVTTGMYNAIEFDPKFIFFNHQGQRSVFKHLDKLLPPVRHDDLKKDELSLMSKCMNEPISSMQINSWLDAIATNSDRGSFKCLFDYFAPRLKSFLIGQGTDTQLAEEVVQETMVKVWRKSHQFDVAKASASTWIFTIARNMRVDLLRKCNRPEPDFNDPAFLPDPEPQVTEIIARNQEAEELNKLIFSLPIEQREVLNLAYFQDMAHAEIADKLNIPLGTVKSRIRLALKRIRVTLGDSR